MKLYSRSVKSWEQALAALPTITAGAIQAQQKRQYQLSLEASKAAYHKQRHHDPEETQLRMMTTSSEDLQDFSWFLAEKMLPELFNRLPETEKSSVRFRR